jgi:hypothetical protein
MLLSAMAAADRGENMLDELSMGTVAGSFSVSSAACALAIASSDDKDLCSAIMVNVNVPSGMNRA